MELLTILDFCKDLILPLTAAVIGDLLMRRKRVARANEEILQIIRRIVAEHDLEGVRRINVAISTVARKHHLSEARLFSLKSLVDEVISEIVANPFIKIEQEKEYCTFADRIKLANGETKRLVKPRIDPGTRKDIGIVLGLAVLGAIVFSFLGTNIGPETITIDADTTRRLFWIAAIAITVPAFLIWLLDLYRDLRQESQHSIVQALVKLRSVVKRKNRSAR